MKNDLSGIDVCILCGGLGTRMRAEIGETQKSMASLNNKPFLEILIENFKLQGFQRIVLCAGYKAEQIEDYFKGKELGAQIVIVKEQQPLGTGGAIKNVRQVITSDRFIALNGDSFCAIDYQDFVDFHILKGACGTLVLARVHDRDDYGTIMIDDDNRITAFQEKSIRDDRASKGQAAFINAGVYCFEQEIFSRFPEGTVFSIEYDFFAKQRAGLYGYEVCSDFIDIGTPERFKAAQKKMGTS